MLAPTNIVTVTLNPAIDRLVSVPNFRVGAHLRGESIGIYPSGKGITTSRALGQLGARNIATGLVGEMEFSDFERYLCDLEQATVNCQLLRVSGPTRDYITVVDPINDMETYIRVQGGEIHAHDLARIRSKIGLLAREDTILCMCGSTPAGVSDADYRSIVMDAMDAGAQVVIDAMDSTLASVADLPVWMFRLNRTAARQLTGITVDSRETAAAAARRLAENATVASVSVGAEGAALAAGGHAWAGYAPVHPGRIVNTVGCGSSLLAGILHGWLRYGDWIKALLEGLAAASANATTLRAGDIPREAVEEFRAVANVYPIAAAASRSPAESGVEAGERRQDAQRDGGEY